MFEKYKFRDVHLQIPDFALLKYQYHALEDMEWWYNNYDVYICETDYNEDELNPNKIIPKQDDKSAIILIKGDVNSKLVSDYNYFSNRNDIIILGNVNADNFIVDKDYYFIGGDIIVKELFYIPIKGEVCAEGSARAGLGILQTDYNLYATKGHDFDMLFSDQFKTPVWDEPYPQDALKRYISDGVLKSYSELKDIPNNWQDQIDITKLYKAIKEKQAIIPRKIDEYYMPEGVHTFTYGDICNKNDWQNQKENFLKLTKLLGETGYKSIHFAVGENKVTYLKEWGRDSLPHLVVTIPELGAMSFTYSETKPNFVAKLLGNKEPEGMIAVLVHGPNDIVTQQWKDDCKVISPEKFNEIWFGILKSADAGIWHKAQFENAVTVDVLREILDSQYIIENFNQDTGSSLSIETKYFRFERSAEAKALQIGYQAKNDGYDARFKYLIKADEPDKLYLEQFIKDFDEKHYHTYFDDVPFIHWDSYRIAKRWFSWGYEVLKSEENEWNKHVNGFSKFVSVDDFNFMFNHSKVESLFENSGEADWSETVEFEADNRLYKARFYRANADCPRSVIRVQIINNDDENDDGFDCTFIKISNTITANDIDFYDDYASLVNILGDYYYQDAVKVFQNLLAAVKK